MSGKPVLSMLADTPFGRALSDGDRSKVAHIAAVRSLEPSVVLFPEGGRATDLFLVISGLVGLDICLPRRGCVRMLTVGPGEFVGWSAIVGSGQMTTRATIVEPATLIALPGDRLQALCDADHDIGYAVMRQVAVGLSQRLLATRLQMLDVFGETEPVRPPDFTGAMANTSAVQPRTIPTDL